MIRRLSKTIFYTFHNYVKRPESMMKENKFPRYKTYSTIRNFVILRQYHNSNFY